MKKIFVVFVCFMVAVVSALGFTACSDKDDDIDVYMPDGAPALAMAKLMHDDASFGKDVDYEVVDASLIQTFVSGENPKADICILPVNLASKVVGSGEVYKMLGTVTHGNLFILKKSGGEDITLENLQSLVGKTVGVINLAAIPGITFKLILKDNNLQFNELGNDGAVQTDKVNLKAVTAEEAIPSNSACDYFVVPEPAASTKVKATNGALSFAGSLQTLYGSANGYPQAVLIAKNSLIEKESEFIDKFINAVKQNAEWLLSDSTSAETIAEAVKDNLTDGMSPTFTSANLSKTVIENCAINFVSAADCKAEVNSFIEKIIALNPQLASTVNDKFYYQK